MYIQVSLGIISTLMIINSYLIIRAIKILRCELNRQVGGFSLINKHIQILTDTIINNSKNMEFLSKKLVIYDKEIGLIKQALIVIDSKTNKLPEEMMNFKSSTCNAINSNIAELHRKFEVLNSIGLIEELRINFKKNNDAYHNLVVTTSMYYEATRNLAKSIKDHLIPIKLSPPSDNENNGYKIMKRKKKKVVQQ